MEKIRVLVVDDHPVFRAGIIRWLDEQPTLTCCGDADSVAAASRATAELRPDIILLDLRLGESDGLELARELSGTDSSPRIIVLSQHDEDAHAQLALEAGARGYIVKSEATEFVLTAIETVLRGDIYLSRRVAARLLLNLAAEPASEMPGLAQLTEREMQVFQLLGAGCSTRDISERLKISPKTVSTYREHLKDKLGLPDAAALFRTTTRWVETGRLDLG